MNSLLGLLVLANTIFNLMVMIDTRRVEKIAMEAKMKAGFCIYFLEKKYMKGKNKNFQKNYPFLFSIV